MALTAFLQLGMQVIPLIAAGLREKKNCARWENWSKSRNFIAGQSSSNYASFKTQVQLLPAFNFCDQGPQNSSWSLIGPNPSYGQQQQYNGLIGCLAVDRNNTNVIYAGTGEIAGMYKTTNHGVNWTNLTDKYNKPGLGIKTIKIDPTNSNHVLAGAFTKIYGEMLSSHGILRSINAGTDWTFITQGYEDSTLQSMIDIQNIEVIRFHPTLSNVVLAAGKKIIWKSTDSGVTWYKVFENTVSFNADFQDLEISLGNPNQICAATGVYGAGDGQRTSQIFCSSNTGQTFTERTPAHAFPYTCHTNANIKNVSPHTIALDVSPVDSNVVYAFYGVTSCSTDYYYFKTPDAGLTWQTINHVAGKDTISWYGNWGPYRGELKVSHIADSIIYIGGNYVIKSTNNGKNWSLISEYFPTSQPPYSTHADIRDFDHLGLSSSGKEIIYMANDGSLSKTTNSGAQWLDLNGNGLIASEADGVAFLNKSGLLAFGNIHNSITTKNNQGNWQYGLYGGDVGWMNVHSFRSDTVFFVNNGEPSMVFYEQLINFLILVFLTCQIPFTRT